MNFREYSEAQTSSPEHRVQNIADEVLETNICIIRVDYLISYRFDW